MPTIIPSDDLQKDYNKISAMCHEYAEPVFITKNGVGDLAVMSMETYELLLGKMKLYARIDEGLDQIEHGKVQPMREIIHSIRERTA